ncbi:MAG: HAD-IA family hydrolase [Clostridia bacterium]|nr:HAD-IA family hydrolase [Clostridia bacterium]
MQNIRDKKYILFDLDGTLTDSYPAITTSFLYAISDYDVELSEADLSSVIGPPLKDSFVRLLGVDPFEAWELVLKYREFYNAGGMFNCKVYDGIVDMLKGLKDSGKVLSVATSKPEEQAKLVLDHFGLTDYFEVIAGDDQKCSRHNKKLVIEYCLDRLGHHDREDVVMVGDRSYDMIGAKDAGVSAIGVTFGYGSTKELKDAGADYIVASAKELKELFVK